MARLAVPGGRRWVAVVVCALAVVGASCGSSSSGSGASSSDGPRPVGEAVDLSAPGLHELSPPPIADWGYYGNRVVVVAGDEVVVWGGLSSDGQSETDAMLDDGAVLSTEDGRWTPMPPSPFREGLYQPLAAWDGTEVVVIGTECQGDVPPITDGGPPECPEGPAAAAFDPASSRWRRLPAPPIPPNPYHDELTLGRRGVAVGGDGRAAFAFDLEARTIAWDRETEQFSTIEAPALGERIEGYCADATEGSIVAATTIRQDDAWVNELWLLDLGADAWEPTTRIDQVIRSDFSCGAGSLTTFDLISDGPGHSGSEGIVVEVRSGTITEAYEPADGLRRPWIVGPWLLAHTDIATSDIADGSPFPPERPTTVRLVAGERGGSVEVAGLDAVVGEWVPGVGIFGLAPSGEPPVLWRAPPELQPE